MPELHTMEQNETLLGAPADLIEIKRVLEAALLVAGEPVAVTQLARLFDPPIEQDTVRKLLDELKEDWQGRKIALVQVASGWRFQTRAEFQPYLEKLQPEKPPRYSRAVMETLAIIAYRQPVTRGDIEDVRGVGVSTQIIQALDGAVDEADVALYNRVGDLLLKQGNISQAVDYYERAVDLYTEGGRYWYTAGWNWRAIAAFLVGGVLAVGGSYSSVNAEGVSSGPFPQDGLIPFLKPLADYGWAVGLATSMLVYVALMAGEREKARATV